MATEGRAHRQVDTDIALTETEAKIFDTLLGACEHHGLSTTLRCAGGWVRDKLLRLESKDIDIAIDDMTGQELGDKVAEYQQLKTGESTKAHTIAARPEQSKHLETATMPLHGLSLDLVNLRSETYSQESRIPTIEIGTPKQDAERRDFTINALFYNLHSREVEDFTGRGLDDLRDGIMRTPLDPRVTFLDDPLRVLRAVRFASRFEFSMTDDLKEAARSPEILAALEKKITRERVGIELAGCMTGPHPVLAAQTFKSLRVFPGVFQLPEKVRAAVACDYGSACVRSLELAAPLLDAFAPLESAEQRRGGHMAALLLPLRDIQCPIGKGKSVPLPSAIVLTSLKWSKKDMTIVESVHQELPELRSLHASVAGLTEAELQDVGAMQELRAQAGRCLARLKDLAPLAGALFPLLDAVPPIGPGTTDSELEAATSDAAAAHSAAARLQHAVEAWGLRDCGSWSPLIDGKQIVSHLGMQRAGPIVGKLMALARDWQYSHPAWHPAALREREPQSAPPDELVEHLKSAHADMQQ